MAGIHTCSHSAEVVEVESYWDFADLLLVREAMRVDAHTVVVELSIATDKATRPQPTIIWT